MKPDPKAGAFRIPHNSPRYKQLLQHVVERDEYTCRVCGRFTNFLNGVHHVLFLSQSGSDTSENLVLLCLKCHDGFHKLALYKGKMVDGEFVYWEITQAKV